MAMGKEVPVGGIHPYDGYVGEPFWKGPADGSTTYYDPALDNQVRVPLRPIDEIRSELEERMAEGNTETTAG